jgi:hypothetical protein
MRDST